MANLKFIIRQYKGGMDKEGKYIIFLRYTHRTKVTHFSSQRKIDPKYWDERNQKVKQLYKGFSAFNMYLDKFRQRMEDMIHNALSQEIEPTIEYVREKINQKEEVKQQKLNQLDFFTYANKFIEDSKINKKESTLIGYRRTVLLFKEFEKHYGKLTWDSFDLTFYDSFHEYMINKRKCGNNYFGSKVKFIKTVLNHASERGYQINPAFRSKKFKVLAEDAENIYLSESEIDKIMQIDLSNNVKLDHVRSLFICGIFTGLRFSDFSSISQENIKDGCIHIKTIKTGTNVIIPCHPFMKAIMEKYKSYPNSLPPSYSNQKMNAHLKEIGKLAGLNETIIITKTKGSKRVETVYKKYQLICTHTARRSFATNLFKQGFPAINIMKITTHKTEKAFMKYIKVNEQEAATMLKNHWDLYYAVDKQPNLKIA